MGKRASHGWWLALFLLTPELDLGRLRSEFNSDIPAILITGDTAPDRLREVMTSGCLLMHMPVSNNRLRAAVDLAAEASTELWVCGSDLADRER